MALNIFVILLFWSANLLPRRKFGPGLSLLLPVAYTMEMNEREAENHKREGTRGKWYQRWMYYTHYTQSPIDSFALIFQPLESGIQDVLRNFCFLYPLRSHTERHCFKDPQAKKAGSGSRDVVFVYFDSFARHAKSQHLIFVNIASNQTNKQTRRTKCILRLPRC